MDEEFLSYLEKKIGDRLITSFENNDLLLWGEKSDNSVKILGITLTIGLKIDEKKYVPNQKIEHIIHIIAKIIKKYGIPFFGIIYPTNDVNIFLVTDMIDPHLNKLQIIEEENMPKLIQSYFKTSYSSGGTLKPVNKSTSDFFHVWSRENLPAEYVKLNIDALILDSFNKPLIFLETKRSFQSLDEWAPYDADSRNYLLQYIFSRKTSLKFWTVYHIKGTPIDDETNISLYEIKKVDLSNKPWIDYSKSIIKSKHFIELI